MWNSDDNTVAAERVLREPCFQGLRLPKGVQAFENVKNPLIAEANIGVQRDYGPIYGIRAFDRSASAAATGIRPEPVTKMAVSKLKRLGLIAIMEVINPLDRD